MTPWLGEALAESRRRGFLGPGPLETHVDHALGYVTAWNSLRDRPPSRILDLGSGGGVPGLILATEWASPVVLLDSMIRRTSFLDEVITASGAPEGITVVLGRAEAVARDAMWEKSFDLVVVRSFGAPSVTAECGTRFLARGGLMIVSEPPDSEGAADRWPPVELAKLGLLTVARRTDPFTYQVLERSGPVPAQFPRPIGVPGKRPLF
jgi:16S rRNA (guanine527-N7)-methyltransferase